MNIILSPHFDDAVLSLGGLLSKEGPDSTVATLFAGAPKEPMVDKWDTTCGFANSTEAMRERTKEDERSLRFLGVNSDRIRRYAHIGSSYRLVRGATELPEPELEASISKEIEALIREFSEKSLKVFIPGLEKGKTHIDHRLVKRSALAAIKKLSSENTIQYFFYQDLPYAEDMLDRAYPRTVWNFFVRNHASKRDYSLLEHRISDESLVRHVIPLTNADMKKKVSAVELYTSQVDHLGKKLLHRLERFSAGQALRLRLDAPYCEVVYQFKGQ